MSQPKQYFKGEEMDKAVEWLKKHMQSGDVVAEIEGTLVETGAQVSCSGLVINAESGFGKQDMLVVRLDKNERWTSEKMVSVGKPGATSNVSVAANEIFLEVKGRGDRDGRRRSSTSGRRDHDHHDDHGRRDR